MERKKKIINTFLNYQSGYLDRGNDMYTASQLAAFNTKEDYNISTSELTNILENK